MSTPLNWRTTFFLLLCLGSFSHSLWAATTSATKGLSCAADRFTDTLGCTAGEFTVTPVFSAESGTNPFCMIGSTFDVIVEVTLSGTNADRQDIGFFVGENNNDPGTLGTGELCSVASFPTTPLPWEDNDGDTCGDYDATGVDTIVVNEIRVACNAGPTGFLEVPYLVSYWQNNGNVCTGPLDVVPGSKSKCNKGVAEVSGAVAVQAGAFFDITKETTPDGDPDTFDFTATGPAGSKVIAYVGGTLTPTSQTGGAFVPADIATATNVNNFTLQDGETVRVFIGATATPQDLVVVESAATGWDPTATSISCATVQGSPAISFDEPTRTMTASLTETDYGAECTITNTRRPSITITKVSNDDIGTFEFTGTNTWATQNITTLVDGVGVAGTTQYLPYSTATTITETGQADWLLTGISCSGMGAGGSATYDVPNRQVTFDVLAMAPGSDITCTYTNQRTRTLNVVKSLSPVGDPGLFVMDANGTTTAEDGDGASSSATINVGVNATFAETAGTGTSLANYTTTYACNDPAVTSGNTSSGNLTMPNQDVTCTFTNTRIQASLTLEKTWANAINGDTATVTSSSFTNNATSGASVSTGNNTTSGGSVTVYSGESGTIAESFSVGDSNNYNASLACSGTSGLSGSTLTVAPADSAITCTYTNSRKSATLTLRKTWDNANNGDTATVVSTGFTNDGTSGASVSTGNNTTSGTSVTVFATESANISESFSVGNPADYSAALACTGTTGLAGSTLTVDPADTAIICTFTNTGLKPDLDVTKTSGVFSDPFSGANPKSIPGSIVTYTIRVTNSGLGSVDNNSVVLTDLLPSEVVLFVNDIGGPGSGPVAFTDGAPISGLSWNFVALGDGTDDLEFSNNNGGTWTYTPTPDADGFDANVTDIRLNPKGTMNAAGGGNPYFEVSFRMKVL